VDRDLFMGGGWWDKKCDIAWPCHHAVRKKRLWVRLAACSYKCKGGTGEGAGTWKSETGTMAEVAGAGFLEELAI